MVSLSCATMILALLDAPPTVFHEFWVDLAVGLNIFHQTGSSNTSGPIMVSRRHEKLKANWVPTVYLW